jgi:hypothetical protein
VGPATINHATPKGDIPGQPRDLASLYFASVERSAQRRDKCTDTDHCCLGRPFKVNKRQFLNLPTTAGIALECAIRSTYDGHANLFCYAADGKACGHAQLTQGQCRDTNTICCWTPHSCQRLASTSSSGPGYEKDCSFSRRISCWNCRSRRGFWRSGRSRINEADAASSSRGSARRLQLSQVSLLEIVRFSLFRFYQNGPLLASFNQLHSLSLILSLSLSSLPNKVLPMLCV